MKPTYSNIKLTTGSLINGICQVQIVPREWLTENIHIDFNTRKVIDEILLEENRSWITLECTPDSYEFEEKSKNSRGGAYFEVSIQGNLNNVTPELMATLETLRNHEMVAILKDKQRRKKVVGNKDAGLSFRINNKEANTQGGIQLLSIDMLMENENLSPFYEV